MEASIILTEECIKKAFNAACTKFLSTVDESIEGLCDEEHWPKAYKEHLQSGREGMNVLLPLFVEIFTKELSRIGRTISPLLAVSLESETGESKTSSWTASVQIAEEMCRELGISHEEVAHDLESTLSEFGKVLIKYHSMLGSESKMDFLTFLKPDDGFKA